MPKKHVDLPKIDYHDGMKIYERIVEIRKNKGLTQLELAERIGIKRDLLASYELGRARIYDEMIYRIAIALKVSPNTLLGFEKETTEEKISLRYTKRIKEIEKLPEHKRKAILKMIDDSIKANK